MAWREWLFRHCGPGLFAGITCGDWLSLLRENRFAVDRPYWSRAAAVTLRAPANSAARRCEEAVYGRRVADVPVEPPLFVLGIWRSGTTHLQNLLAADRRFAHPNWYQVSYPHSFLSTERVLSGPEGFFVPRRRLQDGMRFGYALPAEDEFALCTATGLSPLLSWAFPRRAEHYDRYLTLRGVPENEIARWKAALLEFVRKLTWKSPRPLVLKSPPHTARVRLLLEIFPGARFLHIHRDPYAVYQSARRSTAEVIKYLTLQRPALDVDARTVRQYGEVFDAYFEEKALISPGRLHEMGFDDLRRDPLGQMRAAYAALGLPDFREVEPALRDYVASTAGYRQTAFPELAPATRERLAHEWRRCFAEWGYPG